MKRNKLTTVTKPIQEDKLETRKSFDEMLDGINDLTELILLLEKIESEPVYREEYKNYEGRTRGKRPERGEYLEEYKARLVRGKINKIKFTAYLEGLLENLPDLADGQSFYLIYDNGHRRFAGYSAEFVESEIKGGGDVVEVVADAEPTNDW